LRSVNFNDKALFINYISGRLGIFSDSYNVNPISKIIFTYITKDDLASEKDRILLQDLSNKSISQHKFNNMNLPITMNPSEYGLIESKSHIQIDGVTYQRYIVNNNNNKTFRIDTNGIINNISILGASDLKWTDRKLSEGWPEAKSFVRVIGKSTMYFVDGELVLRKQELNVKPFKKDNIDKQIITNFVTFDIETKKELDGKLTPYLISAFNGYKFIDSFGSNQNVLFKNFLSGLLQFSLKTAQN
jgi:hypothetical protein